MQTVSSWLDGCSLSLSTALVSLAGDMQIAPKKNLDAFQFPILFASNAGQWPADVKFKADMAGGYSIWFESNRLLIDARGSNQSPLEVILTSSCDVPVVPEKSSSHFSNYYLGSDSTKWHEGVPSYASIRYRGVADGVDLLFYSNSRKQLEFDYELAPGASLSQIQREFIGADSIVREKGNKLAIYFAGIVLHESIPVSYVIENNSSVPFDVQYQLTDDRVAFAANDDELQRRVVDPVLYFSTYLGGSDSGGTTGADWINGITSDNGNAVYATGFTLCKDYPLVMPVDVLLVKKEVIVTKFQSDASTLIWSTYIGGQEDDEANDIAISRTPSGGQSLAASLPYLAITGRTESMNYPAFSSSHSYSGLIDAFVSRLTADSGLLKMSRYFGGAQPDIGYGVAINTSADAGNIYITGGTFSRDLPGPSNSGYFPPFQSACALNTSENGFLASFDTTGSGLLSTYLCGDTTDSPREIAVSYDTSYVTGITLSENFAGAPFPAGFRKSNPSGTAGFVVAITPNGQQRVYGTFIGGFDGQKTEAFAVTVDGSKVWVGGETRSASFDTVQSNTFDYILGAPSDAFLIGLSQNLVTRTSWTFFGGADRDAIFDLSTDELGNVYCGGFTISPDSLLIPMINSIVDGGYSGKHFQGVQDGFIAQFSSSGKTLHFSSYVGGGDADEAYSVRSGKNGRSFLGGRTLSSNYPVKHSNGNDYTGETFQSFGDGFVLARDCCVGMRGNIDGSLNDTPDIGDLTLLVDYLFITFETTSCHNEASLDGVPGIDIADLTLLVEHLYITFADLPSCD